MTMTWREFVEFVEHALDAEGYSRDVPIHYIDVTEPNLEHQGSQPEVGVAGDPPTLAIWQ